LQEMPPLPVIEKNFPPFIASCGDVTPAAAF
jgi:hypothetical protein